MACLSQKPRTENGQSRKAAGEQVRVEFEEQRRAATAKAVEKMAEQSDEAVRGVHWGRVRCRIRGMV